MRTIERACGAYIKQWFWAHLARFDDRVPDIWPRQPLILSAISSCLFGKLWLIRSSLKIGKVDSDLEGCVEIGFAAAQTQKRPVAHGPNHRNLP